MTADTLVIWVLSPAGKVSAVRQPIQRDTLFALIHEYRWALGVQGAGPRLTRGVSLEAVRDPSPVNRRPWEALGQRLASVLLPASVISAVAGAAEVLILPQGPLALLPFAALPVGDRTVSFGATVPVRYAPSLATLSQAEASSGIPRGPQGATALRGGLVVGNPTMPEVAGRTGSLVVLEPLPGAEAEAGAVAARLGTRVVGGASATESAIRQRLPAATIIHLATHGFAYSSEARARESFVALAPDSTHDGLLTVGEILDDPSLKLTADLVVLSACQSGLGDPKTAEGTIGLQRALLARGARSILVSLWSVSDEATRRLMTSFYRHWLDDTDRPSKAEALRRAQESLRRTPGFHHPRNWAAFQLVGAR